VERLLDDDPIRPSISRKDLVGFMELAASRRPNLRMRWSVCWSGPEFLLEPSGFRRRSTRRSRDQDRFDFGDTDFEGGFNFIAGARSRGGTFFELKTTACGVTTVRLMGGFNF
jgi:hypothetical protein